MSPRPRKVSDDDLLQATLAVMGRVGPRELTLAAIAREAGVTAAVLVQRFGSKRGLLLELTERYGASAGEMFAGLRARAPSPLAAIRAYVDCMAEMGTSPEAVAHHLGWLQQDLADPAFREHLVTQARATRRELRRLIRSAVEHGELVAAVDAAELARTIEVTVGGSLIAWAVHHRGSARTWLRHDLETALRPWLAMEPRGRRP